MTAISDIPAALSEALAGREATVSESWREPPRVYLRATSPQGKLFARYTTERGDEPTLAHEAAVRAIVGTEGDLRAPAVLEQRDSWLLEQAITSAPAQGPDAIDAIAAAAAALASLQLPEGPPRAAGGSSGAVRRRLKLLRSPLRTADLLASRRILARPELPQVTGHGDFHAGNLLFGEGGIWVVDWELCGRQPAGLDLMQCWATLEQEDDRERLFEAAVSQVGESRRAQLARLRYAIVVRTIASKLSAPAEFDRDPVGAASLLRVLPQVRVPV